jgi:hypothetical protein
MPRSDSGKFVIITHPKHKEALYRALDEQNMTLREWFLKETAKIIDSSEFDFSSDESSKAVFSMPES